MKYTTDYLLDKKITVFQPVDGYRASSDAVILSSMVKHLKKTDTVLDIGSGTGAISLCLAARFKETSITGLEIQPKLAELSTQSAAANGFENLKFINCDIRKPPAIIKNQSFNHIITNPPYSDHDMPSPNPSKAFAHNHQEFNLSSWLSFAIKRLAPNGYLYTINRAEAIDEILHVLHGKIGNITIIPLFSKDGQPAKRVLLSARRDSRAPTQILPSLLIHTHEGGYTEKAEKILKEGKSLWE